MLEGRCLIQLVSVCHGEVYNRIRSGNRAIARWTLTAGKTGSKVEETEDERHTGHGVRLQIDEPRGQENTVDINLWT